MDPAVFLPRGGPAPQVTLGFVAGQNRLHLPKQAGADPPQPHRNVLMDRGFAASERPRRRPHRGGMLHNVLAQQHRTPLRITLHMPIPPARLK